MWKDNISNIVYYNKSEIEQKLDNALKGLNKKEKRTYLYNAKEANTRELASMWIYTIIGILVPLVIALFSMFDYWNTSQSNLIIIIMIFFIISFSGVGIYRGIRVVKCKSELIYIEKKLNNINKKKKGR